MDGREFGELDDAVRAYRRSLRDQEARSCVGEIMGSHQAIDEGLDGRRRMYRRINTIGLSVTLILWATLLYRIFG